MEKKRRQGMVWEISRGRQGDTIEEKKEEVDEELKGLVEWTKKDG